MTDGLEFDIEAPDFRTLFTRIKDVEPKIATGLRRELRAAGEEIIGAQRAILSGSKPGSVRSTGKKLRLIKPGNGARPYFAFRKQYEYGAEKTGGVSDLREKIAAGLRTRIVAGKTRQAISIATTGPRNGGYNMAKVWQKKDFRHPVFGGKEWIDQQGQPYFFAPIYQNRDKVRDRIADVIEQTIRGLHL